MSSKRTGFRYPLHITISTLFIGLIVVFGFSLSGLNYRKTSEIIVSAGDQLFDQISSELKLEYQGTYRAVTQAVDILALSGLDQALDLEQRLEKLRIFNAALGNEATLSAIQVGYDNGDYFIVKPVKSEYTKSIFAAPVEASLVVDNITTADNGDRLLERLFFDKQLRELGRNVPELTEFDPRLRPWYRQATGQSGIITTRPYLFYFLGKVGATFARKAADGHTVIAADITLQQLSAKLAEYKLTANGEVLLFGRDGGVIAYPEPDRLIIKNALGNYRIAHMTQLGSKVLSAIGEDLQLQPGSLQFDFEGQSWLGGISEIHITDNIRLYVLMVSPERELLSRAIMIRSQSVFATLLVILLAIPIVWLFARTVANPLRRLADDAGRISRFDFSTSLRADYAITEVNQLAQAMALMQGTISKFLLLINSISAEKNLDALLQGITRESRLVTQADGALVFLFDDKADRLVAGDLQTDHKIPSELPVFMMSESHPLVQAARKKQTTLISLDNASPDVLNRLLDKLEIDAATMIVQPLRNNEDDLVGLLCLLKKSMKAQQPDTVELSFIQAFSGFAAVSLEGRRLLLMQKELLYAFIKLIAGAIDSKSPYTGGHCQRVPELTRMLAESACASHEQPFADFELDEEGWEELHIASWLHDCGKVTTPEYVVDKATKLETLYDRIHEVRMRFEVLKKEAEIDFWKRLAQGGDQASLQQELDRAWRQLDEDFAFVAECNTGGEFMADESIARLDRIAQLTWTRTLDDSLGISWEEKQRKQTAVPDTLPVHEPLLADREEHLIRQTGQDVMSEDNVWGFKLDLPRFKFNRGELHNLKVGRGTLTEEERCIINDHIVQTIIMLEKLPFPKSLQNVPAIAGAHHETMDGRGYPRRLLREEMHLTARMMAIADIFEALTASDRPYKKAKKLSEALRIMKKMVQQNHIDSDLFRLFISSGVYRRYAEKYLQSEQIDIVSEDELLD